MIEAHIPDFTATAEALFRGKEEHEKKSVAGMTVDQLVAVGRGKYQKYLQVLDKERAWDLAVAEMAGTLNPGDLGYRRGFSGSSARGKMDAEKHSKPLALRGDVRHREPTKS